MRLVLRSLLLICILVTAAGVASAQVQTGLPPFDSFSTNGPVQVNLANLNVHITLPIASKAGRGLPFVYDFSKDSSIWYPSGTSGSQTWVLTSPTFGFTTGLPAWNGSVSYTYDSSWVYVPPPYNEYIGYDSYSNYAYTDPSGTLHTTTYSSYEICEPTCSGGAGGSLATTDGSGYWIISGDSVEDRSGTVITTGSGSNYGNAGSIQDTNGNYLSANVSGNNYVITDTLGQNVLTMPQSTSGSTATYTVPTGTVTVYYGTRAVKTNFQCSGVSEYGSVNKSLPYMIKLPDGSAYTIGYEPIYDSYGDLYTNGRISSIGLPSGGTIYIDYTGPNDGTSCTDGSTTGLEVSGPNGDWKYSRSGSQTTVTAPQLSYDSTPNQTVYTFDAYGHETKRQIYQGSATGTPLETIDTTWNSSNTMPATTVTTLSEGGSSIQSAVDTSYDSLGNLLSKTEHGWGSGSPGSVFRTTSYTYKASYGGISDLLTEETIADGSGTIRYRKDISYDDSQITNCPTGVVQHDDTYHGCSFNTRGNPTTVTTYTDPINKQGPINKTFAYDVFGNEISAQLNCCQLKTWSYSGLTHYAFPDSVTKGSSSPKLTTSYSYNLSTGVLTSVTDPNGLTTTYNYDSSGRPSGETRPDGQQVTITYVPGSQVTYQGQTYTTYGGTGVTRPLDSSGHTITQGTTIDTFGRPVAVSSGSMSVCYGYDAMGRRWETSNPRVGCPPYYSGTTYWTQTQFDALGRPTETILPDGEISTYTYGIQNSLPTVTVTDPVGNKREAVSDAAGHLVAVYEPDPSNGNSLSLETTYTYDVLDDLTQVSQGQQTRTYGYDALGRLTSASIPEANGAATTYTYDSFDNLTSRTDPRGVITNYYYDGLNRLTNISYTIPQGSSVSAMPNDCDPTSPTGTNYTANVCLYYDQGGASAYALGKLTEMKDPTGSETYTFDKMGDKTQVQKLIGSTTYTTSYQYNYAGEITQITYPSGHVVTPSYDTLGRLASIAGNLSGTTATYASGFSYDAAQQVTQFEYGNGIYGSFGFSPDRLQLTCLDYSPTNRNGTCAHDSTSLLALDYGYAQNGGNNGQITSIAQTVAFLHPTTDYSYDALSRLVDASYHAPDNVTFPPEWELQWSYDRYGNRTAQTVAYGTGPSNAVAVDPFTNHIVSPGYTYDANGNMTNDGENALTYDGENRITSSTGNLGSGSYVYDGNGLRVEKTSGGTTTVYIYSGSKVIAEYDNGAAPSNPSREYAYSGSALLAKADSSGIQYYQEDQSSVRLITDASGSVIGSQSQYPYGELLSSSGTATNWAFTSYERDSENGNDYALGREYVNRLGRFTALDAAAPDSTDPQTMNRYSYAGNDPINEMDPSGEAPGTCIDGYCVLPFWWMDYLAPDTYDWLEFASIDYYSGPWGDADFYHAALPDAFAMDALPMNGGAPNFQGLVSQIVTRLLNDTNCLSFLGSNDPHVLDTISNTPIGVDNEPQKPGMAAYTLSEYRAGIVAPVSSHIYVNPSSYAFDSSLNIVAQPEGSSMLYVSGSPAAEVQSLIHEFGHATGVLLRDVNPKTGKIDNVKESENNQAIQEHCQKTIDSFPGVIQPPPKVSQ